MSIITPASELLEDLNELLKVKQITKLERSRYLVNVRHYYIVFIIAIFIHELFQPNLSREEGEGREKENELSLFLF